MGAQDSWSKDTGKCVRESWVGGQADLSEYLTLSGSLLPPKTWAWALGVLRNV